MLTDPPYAGVQHGGTHADGRRRGRLPDGLGILGVSERAFASSLVDVPRDELGQRTGAVEELGREDDRGVLLHRDLAKNLQITQLQSDRMIGDDVRASARLPALSASPR